MIIKTTRFVIENIYLAEKLFFYWSYEEAREARVKER